MRLIGFLLVLAGLGLAIGYPLYQSDYTGSEFHRERIYDRARDGSTTAWKQVALSISESDNPVRIRLEGKRGEGDSYIGTSLPVTVQLDGPDGTVLSARLDMNLASDPDRSNPGEQRLYINAPDFDVLSGGQFTLKTTPQINRDISLLWMEAVFLKNVERPTNEYLRPGLITAGIGAALWFAGSRRRRSKNKKAKPKPSRWGRR